MRIVPLIFARIALAALLIVFAGGFGTCGERQAVAPAPAASAAGPTSDTKPTGEKAGAGAIVARTTADQAGQGPSESGKTGSAGEVSAPQIVLAETPTGIVLFDSGLSIPRAVTFAQGSWKDIVESDLPMLQDLSRLLRERPDIRIMILGHRTSEETALVGGADISLKRAQTVRDFLVRSGVLADRILIGGAGDGYPIRTAGAKTDSAENCRVEIFQVR